MNAKRRYAVGTARPGDGERLIEVASLAEARTVMADEVSRFGARVFLLAHPTTGTETAK